MKKKVLIIVVIAVILGVIGTLLTLYFIDRAKYVYDIEKVTEINYNIINKNDRYGVIDRQGNVLVDPIYDIIQIPNPSKPIFICMSNYNVENKEYETKVLNDKGEELYTEYSHIQAIPNESTEDGIPFEKTVLQYKKDGKYGLLNINGTKITEPEYDQIDSMAYKEGMMIVKKDGKLGVINLNGVFVIDIEYNSILPDNYYGDQTKYETTGFIVSQKKEDGYRYGYINYKGHVILDTEYTEIERVTDIQNDKNVYIVALKNGQAGLLKNKDIILNYEYEDIIYNSYNDVFVIQRNKKQGIADRNGNIKINPEYDNILFGGIYVNAQKGEEYDVLDINGNPVVEEDVLAKIPTEDKQHYIIADKNEFYKIVDAQGNSIIDKNYSYIEELYNNYYIVGTNNKNGIIDLTGKSKIELQYTSIFKIEGTNIIQANISDKGIITLINSDMKIIASMENAGIQIEDNYVHLYNQEENKYFDFNGKEISYKTIYPNNKLYAKQINGKWGFVDENGNLKIQNQYDMVTEFNEYGYAGIKVDEKWGSIDTNGTVIQEPIYEITWPNPTFIGKYYKEVEWYGELYYTDKIEEQNEKDKE